MKCFFVYVETHDKPKLEWFDTFEEVMIFKSDEERVDHTVYVYQLCGLQDASRRAITDSKPISS